MAALPGPSLSCLRRDGYGYSGWLEVVRLVDDSSVYLLAREATKMSMTEAPIVDMTRDEYAGFLSQEVERGVGMTVREFITAYTAGELDDSDPEVARLAALLALGQNGA